MKTILENYLQNLSEARKDANMIDVVIRFFQENPNPSDDQVHKFAEEQGMEPDDLEEKIYELLSSLINLKGSEIPDEKFDSKELSKGTKVEKEHHDNPIIAKAISKSHLLEIKDYYTRLKKMENEAGIED